MRASIRRLLIWTLVGLALFAAHSPAGAATVAAGQGHSAAVLPDGSVYVWGANDRGQLGDGTVAPSLPPQQVSGPTEVVAVASGDGHILALTSTGDVWAWGANDAGQVGDNTSEDRLVPLIVLSGAVGIDAGPEFSLAWKADGSLWTWGANDSGQLGDGTQQPSDTPAEITGVTGVVQASAGDGHVLALVSDGSIWSWGANASGQLGDGTQQGRLSPVAVTAVPDASAVVAGEGASYVVRSDGSLWAWGNNAYGQLGDGTTTSRLTAAVVGIPATVQGVRPGGGHVLARLADGTLRSWGRNAFGQVGDGTTTNRPTPVTLTLADVSDIAAGHGHSVAVTTQGVVWAWGRNASGQLGDGTAEDRLAPIAVTGWGYSWKAGLPVLAPSGGIYEVAQDVTATSATAGATIRYTTDGTEPDDLGPSIPSGAAVSIGETTTLKAQAVEQSHTPSDVVTAQYTLQVPAVSFSPGEGTYPGPQTVTLTCAEAADMYYTDDGSDPDESATLYTGAIDVSHTLTLKVRAYRSGWDPSAIAVATYELPSGPVGAIAAGENFSLALRSDGALWSWGQNSYGVLGDGSTTTRKIPGQVNGISGVSKIAAGTRHALAITGPGDLYSWGANDNGQIGDGTTTTRKLPVQVATLGNVVEVAAGYDFSLALTSDGTLYSWGRNNYGQLGLGDTATRTTPTQVMTDVVGIAAGKYHAFARKTDGTLWGWGSNGYGRVGDGTTTQRTSPVQVTALSSVTHVAAGGEHSLGGLSDGTVYGWGRNYEGQVGDGTTVTRTAPTPALLLSNPTMLRGGEKHSLAVGPSSGAWAWGYNNKGQIGDGSTTKRTEPTPVPGLTDITAVAAGSYHSLALASDGSIYAWGSNYNGALGDGTSVDRLNPVKISEGEAWRVATPTFNPDGGTFTSERPVSVQDLTPGADIHYTTNGLDPTVGDPQVAVGGSVLVDQSLILKARAFKAGVPDSPVASATFVMTVPTPNFSKNWGTYNTPLTVTISCTLSGAAIHYTTNGLEPTQSDPVIASGASVSVDVTQTIKAKAWRPGWNESTTRSNNYTLAVGAPTLTPGGGSYSVPQAVTVATVTPDAILTYTLDGREPSGADAQIASGATVLVDRSLTLRVRGFRFGWSDSTVASAGYYFLAGTAATPAFSPAPGTYTEAQDITISSATPGAAIRYTTDGAEPGPSSPLYTGPVTVDGSITLKAKTYGAELAPSATASGAYTITVAGVVTTPSFAPSPGQYASGRAVTIATLTPGATLRYTTTGENPTASDTEIASGASTPVDRTMVLKAKGWKDGLTESGVRSGFYVITGALAAAPNSLLALLADGTVVGWGANAYGQLGDGTTTSTNTPVAATGLSDVIAIAAGARHSVALRADGKVFCWGDNDKGQLGDGTTTDSHVPQEVPGLSGVVAIAAGDNHTLAVKADGTGWAWGNNGSRQLGDGSNITRYSPVPISGLSDVVSLAGGLNHSLALTADGQVWGWGSNTAGQAGDGTTTLRATPVPVLGLAGVSRIWAGQWFSLALKTDGLEVGSLWGWGANDFGQLATGDTTKRTSPVHILDGVTSAAASSNHALAIKPDGSLWAWGAGGGLYGKLGDGARVNRFAPVQVWGLRDVVVAAGCAMYSAAVRADGTVFTWGYNIGSTYSDTPIASPELSLVDNAWLTEDADGDGLSVWGEWQSGCDPLNPDTNADGLGDGTSVGLGLSCWNPDLDGDGISNAEERLAGTSPWIADTDEDGVPDGADCAPLDPTTTTCPVDPEDHTPPVITILEPPNATPLP